MNADLEALADALHDATRPRCEHGHDRISLNADTGRLDCPVPEHDPQRVIDIADATVIWEAPDASTDTNPTPARAHAEVTTE